jgi:hypothetical protein
MMTSVVGDDTEDEAPEWRSSSMVLQGRGQREEGVLHEILGRAPIAEEAPRERPRVFVMFVVELAE